MENNIQTVPQDLHQMYLAYDEKNRDYMVRNMLERGNGKVVHELLKRLWKEGHKKEAKEVAAIFDKYYQ